MLMDDPVKDEKMVRGELLSFEELFKLHHRKVYAVCLRMTGNTAEAEDLSQEEDHASGASRFDRQACFRRHESSGSQRREFEGGGEHVQRNVRALSQHARRQSKRVRAIVLPTGAAAWRNAELHRLATLLDHQARHKEHRHASVGKHAIR
jgi:hypothetical protein